MFGSERVLTGVQPTPIYKIGDVVETRGDRSMVRWTVERVRTVENVQASSSTYEYDLTDSTGKKKKAGVKEEDII